MGPGSRSRRWLVRDDEKIGTIVAIGEGLWHHSRQLVEAFAEPVQAERKADALFGGLEDDEGRGLGAAQLAQELVVHYHFRNAAIGQAAYKTGAANILVIELQA